MRRDLLALPLLALPLSILARGHARAGASTGAARLAPEECLPLHPAHVRLTGAPQYQLYAPPAGASAQGRDASAPDTAIMFALETPADVCADSGRGLSHAATRVAAVELVGAPATIGALIGYGVEAQGRLAYALPGAHHAEVVLYVDRLPLPGTDARSARRPLPDDSSTAAR